MTTLLLWDIDGTLLSSAGAGKQALQEALLKCFGVSSLLDGVDFSGRTDPLIIRDIFARHGLPFPGEHLPRFVDAYLDSLPGTLRRAGARVLPGVTVLLRQAAERGMAQGLLTGNLRRGAEVKLAYHGLWEHFPFGAFSDDSEDRNALGPHALRRARERHGVEFSPRRTWIIGDTPRDVACARAIGANCLVVATGGHPLEELAALGPAGLLPDLSDAAAFWAIVDRADRLTGQGRSQQ